MRPRTGTLGSNITAAVCSMEALRVSFHTVLADRRYLECGRALSLEEATVVALELMPSLYPEAR